MAGRIHAAVKHEFLLDVYACRLKSLNMKKGSNSLRCCDHNVTYSPRTFSEGNRAKHARLKHRALPQALHQSHTLGYTHQPSAFQLPGRQSQLLLCLHRCHQAGRGLTCGAAQT